MKKMKTLEQIRELFRGDNFTHYNGFEIISVDENSAVVSVDIKESHYNGLKVAHGGLIFTLADFAFSVHANRGDIESVTSTASITYLSAACNNKLIAIAKASKIGRRTNTYQVDIVDEKDRKIAQVIMNGFNIS